MAFSPEDIAEVRARTDLVALISEKSSLRRVGRRWTGLCPFHQEKSPSFSVNGEEGFYHCFGCGVSGDAISFVRAIDHLDFAEAVRFLAQRCGVTLTEDPAQAGQSQRRAALYQAVDAAVEWYHQRLLSAPDAGRARDYLRSRGYNGDVVRQFRLGWAPDDWDAMSVSVKLPPKVMEEAGLSFTNRAGRQQDFFRNRVTFPICDPSGRAIAMGARILPMREGEIPDPKRGPEPKYKNSTETPIYVKNRTLYALNWAKADIVRADEVVVCEGYTDVIGCFQAGIPRAVATCGTALTEDHFKTLSNFAKRIVLAFDADAAGQNAITRVYEWERTHSAEVVVAAMPEGSDPGQLAREDPQTLIAAIAGARPFLAFRVDRVLGLADLSAPERRAAAAERALAVVAEHPSDLARDQYVMSIADRCSLDADNLRRRLEQLRRDPEARAKLLQDRKSITRREVDEHREPEAPRPIRLDPRFRPGLEALRIAVHFPERVATRLEPALFIDPIQRAAFEALLSAESLQAAVDGAGDAEAQLLRQLIVDEPMVDVTEVGDPVEACIVQLVRTAAKRNLDALLARARTEPEKFAELSEAAASARRLLDELVEPATSGAAEVALVQWIAAQEGATQ